MAKQLRILILMAKTGGGHSATATAIKQALEALYKDKVYIEIVDGLRDFAPFPISHLDVTYPWQLKLSTKGYGIAWKTLNNTKLASQFVNSVWPLVKNAAYKIVRKKFDVIVATHPAFVYPCLRARVELGKKVKFVSVVPDLGSSHATWCDSRTDLLLTPTQEAANEAIRHGVPKEKIKVTGLPLRAEFTKVKESKSVILKSMGLNPTKKTVLLMGGGDGNNKLYDLAKKINSSKLVVQLITVSGKNSKVLKKLNNLNWKVPHILFGFTQNIPQLMRASDILITKGGPTTIAEALVMGLPTIIFDYIPNQETKNVELSEKVGAGKLLKNTSSIIKTISTWTNNPKILPQMSKNALKNSDPKASLKAAKEIYELVSKQFI